MGSWVPHSHTPWGSHLFVRIRTAGQELVGIWGNPAFLHPGAGAGTRMASGGQFPGVGRGILEKTRPTSLPLHLEPLEWQTVG
jgi:hypothetical protein